MPLCYRWRAWPPSRKGGTGDQTTLLPRPCLEGLPAGSHWTKLEAARDIACATGRASRGLRGSGTRLCTSWGGAWTAEAEARCGIHQSEPLTRRTTRNMTMMNWITIEYESPTWFLELRWAFNCIIRGWLAFPLCERINFSIQYTSNKWRNA